METTHLGLSAPRPLTLCPLSSVLWVSVLMTSRVSPHSSGWPRTGRVDQVRLALHSENSACSCPLSTEGKGVRTHAQPLWIIDTDDKDHVSFYRQVLKQWGKDEHFSPKVAFLRLKSCFKMSV